MKSCRKTRDASRRAIDLTALDTFIEVKRRVGVGFSELQEVMDAVVLLRQDVELLQSVAEFLGGEHKDLADDLVGLPDGTGLIRTRAGVRRFDFNTSPEGSPQHCLSWSAGSRRRSTRTGQQSGRLN